MKINEIEILLGITRANIRFYEKEGLLSPARKENGYREYSEQDIAILKKIIIFRKLGLSLPQIRAILEGTLDIPTAIEENIKQLHQQIAELNGALEVCTLIKKEAPENETFDENHYWELIHQKEKNGEDFAALAKDYLEMEKHSFLTMWSSVFFMDFKDTVQKHGWKIVVLLALGICVVRGIVQELFWPGGSFLEGFTYPFFLFGTITIITIPIFFLYQKYKDAEPEEERQYKHPALISVCKWIGGLTYFVAYLIFIPGWAEDILIPRADDFYYVATYDMFFIYWLMGMYVLCIFIFFYSKHGIFPDRISGEEGIKANVPRKVKRTVSILSVLALFLSLFPSVYWYDCFTEEGVMVQRFFYSKNYSWDEIDYYTLSASFDGTLTYSVVMQDGTKADCIGGGAMVSEVHLPEDRYPDWDYDFARDLSKKFTEQGVELKIDNWDKLYKDLKYPSWIELAEDIREIAEQ